MNESHHTHTAYWIDSSSYGESHAFPAAPTCECITWHVSMSLFTHKRHIELIARISDSHAFSAAPTCECITWHVWMRHFTYMNTSCHTYGCVMSHIWMSHVTRTWHLKLMARSTATHKLPPQHQHVNASRHVCEWVTSRVRTSHVTCVKYESRRKCQCIMSRTWIRHVTRKCVSAHVWVSHVTCVIESWWHLKLIARHCNLQ